MTEIRKRPVLVQFIWLLRHRPAHALRSLRSFLLFWCSHLMRSSGVLALDGVKLGCNVRLQRNRSVMAEAPAAHISIGDHCVVYEDSTIEGYGSGSISIGASSVIGGAKIVSRYGISIGERFLCSWGVFIQDYDSHPVDRTLRSQQVLKMVEDFRPRFGSIAPQHVESLTSWNFPGDPIVIGNDVWIGANSTILKGAKIGDGCIIAAGSVVLRGQYPAHSLIAGNPATIIKSLAE